MEFVCRLKFKRSAKANGENLCIVLNLFRRVRVKIKSLTPELAFYRSYEILFYVIFAENI